MLRELAVTLDGLIRSIDVLRTPLKPAGNPATRPDCVLSRLGGDEVVSMRTRSPTAIAMSMT